MSSHQGELVAELTKSCLMSIYQNVNPKVTNVRFGYESRLLWEKHIARTIGDLEFAISRDPFSRSILIKPRCYDRAKETAD